MKKSDEFDTILDECLERILAGETVEACLARHPEHADELRPLLETCCDARDAADVAPRPEFRQEASRQFQQALQNLPARQPVGTFGFLRHWWVTAVVVLVVIVFGGGGTVFAANSAQPDNFLYPVKLVTESVRISLAGSDQAKAKLYAEFTQRRVDEIVAMAEKGDTAAVARATDHMESQLVAMAGVIGGDQASYSTATNGKFGSAQTPAATTRATATTAVPTTSATTAATPSALAVPSPVPAPTATAPGTITVTQPPPATVTFIQPQPTPTAATGLAQGPEGSFESGIAAQAAAAAQKLRDALNNAPEAARAGLEHALDVLNNGYGQVLHGLGK